MPQISLTTACAPWYPLAELVPLLKQCGYQAIEVGLTQRKWDPGQPPSFWGNNAAMLDWAQAEIEATALRAQLDAAGLPCCCIGSYASTDDIARIATAIACARILGAEFVRVRPPAWRPGLRHAVLLAEARAAFSDLAAISRETGVDCLIELHDGTICPSASAAMRVLEDLDPSLVGVIYDPANFAREGLEDIAMGIDLLGPWLRHVHVKNSSMKPTAASNQHGVRCEAPAGDLDTGFIDWDLVFRLLAGRGWEGACSIEDFQPSSDPRQTLRRNAAWLGGKLHAAWPQRAT